MISSFAFQMFLGIPAANWLGILALFFMLAAFTIAFLTRRGIGGKYFKFHPKLGITAVIFAVIHGIIMMLVFLGY